MKIKFRQCANCSEERQFIDKPGKLIYTCGSKSGKCGPQMTINLARYKHYPEMKIESNQISDSYIDKNQLKEVFTPAEIKEESEFIKENLKISICARRLEKLKKNFKNEKNVFFQRVDISNQKSIKRFWVYKDQ